MPEYNEVPFKKQKFVTNSNIKDRQRFQIIQRTRNPDFRGIKLDGRPIPFGPKSKAIEIDDPGMAKEIHDTHGQGGAGHVLVCPIEKPPDPNHRRTFTVNISFDENGRIIRD